MNKIEKKALFFLVVLIFCFSYLLFQYKHESINTFAANTSKTVETTDTDTDETYQNNLQSEEMIQVMIKEKEEKNILFIGDSITWLDGHTVNEESKNVGEIIGFQDIFRNNEYNVSSYGVSGSTYRIKNDQSQREHGSLYTDVVEDKKVDVSNKRVIVLFAGTNDIEVGPNYGDINSTSTDTTLGALNLMLDYIHNENKEAKIYVVSPIYSSLENRPVEQLQDLTNKMRDVSKKHDATYIDLYDNGKINKETSEKYLYDGLHPNNEGMKVIGKKMFESIDE